MTTKRIVFTSPARGPWIWCDNPPVPKMTTLRSSSQLSTAFLIALPSM